MELNFRNLTSTYVSPPSFNQLAGKLQDRRVGNSRILLIITSYKDSIRLKHLLSELSKQRGASFDVLIVYGSKDEFVDARPLSAVHLREKGRLGFAGAVYLGQIFAEREGYDFHIISDVDKIPASPNAIRDLYKAIEDTGADYSFGRSVISGTSYSSPVEGSQARVEADRHYRLYWPAHWCLIRTSSLLKAGKYLFPLYLGLDDAEYGYRMHASGLRHAKIDSLVFHTLSNNQGTNYMKLLEKGGQDSSYLYTCMMGALHFPQCFYSPFRPTTFLFFPLTVFKLFLSYRLMALRLPSLHAYRANAEKRLFGVFTWNQTKEDISVRLLEIYSIPSAARKLSCNTSKLFLESLFDTGNQSKLLDSSNLIFITLALFDSFYVIDAAGNTAFLVQWQRKVSRLAIIREVATASIEALLLWPKSLFLYAAKRHFRYAAQG